jgi:hypothetical protein
MGLRTSFALVVTTVLWCAAIGCGSDDAEVDPPTPFAHECYEDHPCEEGLACSDVDSRANFQCTTRCDSDAECRDRYGVALCSEDGYCVKECTADSDCSGPMHCNTRGWCSKFY